MKKNEDYVAYLNTKIKSLEELINSTTDEKLKSKYKQQLAEEIKNRNAINSYRSHNKTHNNLEENQLQ